MSSTVIPQKRGGCDRVRLAIVLVSCMYFHVTSVSVVVSRRLPTLYRPRRPDLGASEDAQPTDQRSVG
jgi:hypothetical protein